MSFGLEELAQASPALISGAITTIKITVLAIVGGMILGTFIAMARLSSIKPLSWAAAAYVNFFRSVPKLLTIIWFYYAFPMVYNLITGKFVSFDTAFASAVAAFLIFESAYFSEVVRAGIQSIRKDQIRAAYALGMNYNQAMRLVVLPQAFRKMTPLLLQESIILFQDTTLVISIGLLDLFNAANVRGGLTGMLTPYILFAGLIYFIVSTVATLGVQRLQKKLRV